MRNGTNRKPPAAAGGADSLADSLRRARGTEGRKECPNCHKFKPSYLELKFARCFGTKAAVRVRI